MESTNHRNGAVNGNTVAAHSHVSTANGNTTPVDGKLVAVNGSAPRTNGTRSTATCNSHTAKESRAEHNVEPIAVVGMSCRLPGGASNPEKLWELLKEGRSAWSETPRDRFNQQAFCDPGTGIKSGTTNTEGGHFLQHDVKAFDASFFGINPIEATAMDPQQRLILEVAYEAFENAGCTLEQLSDTRTGVYVGLWASDYQDMLTRDMEYSPTYQVTGTGPAIASNRVSYWFNLKGPSFTVDTGCSASLVALHQAIHSLRSGEAEKCFVAGVNLLLDPQRYSYQSPMGMTSKGGKSFPFDHRALDAGGYGRGEGCSGVVLMPLSAAREQGYNVRAIIRNTAISQDGKTQGITVPNPVAQSDAIERAYNQAGLTPYADYVEAHGTGTKVGDPIEARAIAKSLASTRSLDNPLPIGSIKGNVGHLESAAGLTALVKAVLMLENGMIPQQANFEKPNPTIDFEQLKIRIPTQLEKTTLRRVSVNSFGYGGTNVHLILEHAGTAVAASENGRSVSLSNGSSVETSDINGHTAWVGASDLPRQQLYVLSAASEKSCQDMAATVAGYVESRSSSVAEEDELLDRLAYTLHQRTIFDYRVGVLAASREHLITELSKVASQPVARASGQRTKPRIAFVFSGQGAQYPRMARELLGTWPRFTESLKRAERCLAACGSQWNLIDELLKSPEESQMERPSLAQPISTAVQLSLVDALNDMEVVPVAVVGHSSGEIAAAYCCKAISFEDAMRVSYHRGHLTEQLIKDSKDLNGAMIAVGASPDATQQVLNSLGQGATGRIAIACYNSPSSVTVSGDQDAVQAFKQKLDEQDTWNRLLRTGGAAYHSHQMLQIASQYYEALDSVGGGLPASDISMVSSVTVENLKEQAINKDYWVHNLVSPVRFDDALRDTCVAKDGSRKIDLLLEVGSHFQLESPIKQTLRTLAAGAADIRYAGTLKRGQDAHLCMMELLRSLYLQKYPAAFRKAPGSATSSLDKPQTALSLLTDLPPYPFDHSKAFWHESRVSAAYRQRRFLPHELLGTLVHDNNPEEPRWRRFLNLKDVPWLRGHGIQGQTVFPAAGYIAMALQAAREDALAQSSAEKIDRYVLRNVSMSQALVLEDGKPDLEISLSLRPQPWSAKKSSGLWKEFRIFSTSSENIWTEHCRGLVQAVFSRSDSTDADADGLSFAAPPRVGLPSYARSATCKKFYHRANELGLEWTAPFDNLTAASTSEGVAIADGSTQLPDVTTSSPSSSYTIHPAALDAYLYHTIVAMLVFEDNIDSPVVPTFIDKLIVAERDSAQTPAPQVTCHASRTDSFLHFDVGIFEKGSTDRPILQASGVTLTKLPGLSGADKGHRDLCHVIDWVTYMPSVTRGRIDEVCKTKIEDVSVINQHRALAALTASYVKSALASTSEADIPAGAYQQHWLRWMQTLSDHEIDPALLDAAEADDGVIAQALKRIGPQLNELLRGNVHPLSLLTEGNLLGAIYSEERCARCITQIAAYCGELGRQNPNMRVLEIGAGTGSSSLPILQALQSSSNKVLASTYEFTDLSKGFFLSARELLADFDGVVDYKILNIEDGPEANGFEPQSYDVVIACNVLHATSRIDTVLKNARDMMRPGGKLILMELTENQPYYNCIFGAFSGWWAGYDEGRTLSPLLSRSEWIRKLQNAGFTQNEPLFWDYPVADGGSMTVFVSENPEPATIKAPLAIDVVGLPEPSASASALTEQLRKRLWDRAIDLCGSSSTVKGEKLSVILPEVCHRLAWDIDPDLFSAVKDRITSSKAVLFMINTATDKDDQPVGNWAYGFCRSLRHEHTSARMVTLEVSSVLEACVEPLSTILSSSTADPSIPNAEVELEFMEKAGQLYVSRVRPEPSMGHRIQQHMGELSPVETPFLSDRGLSAELGVQGLFDTIRWVDDSELSVPLDPDHIKLQLCAASINFKDILIASGQLEGISRMRNDCSGVVLEVGEKMKDRFKPGDRVCALYSQPYANYPVIHGDCCQIVPDGLDMDAAVSIPIVWATTYYSLVHAGKLKTGDRILIHSAAGAVGQAAIMLARHLGAEIFVTCGSEAKVQLLVEEFGVAADHVFSSRTTAFRHQIQAMTGGRGVDVVLNSLSGEMFRESCNALAPFGRFVEIGRKDLMEDALMPMAFLLKNITFAYVDMAHIIDTNKQLAHQIMSEVMPLLASNAVQPVKLTKFPLSRIAEAFRLIQAGKHTGKVVLTVEDNQMVQAVHQKPSIVKLQADATYVVVGGLGGLGKCIVEWLAKQGARNIVTLSRSGSVPIEAQGLVDRLRCRGVKVQVMQCDVSSETALKEALASAQEASLPRIRGVIQAAMVLDDVLVDNMTADHWRKAMDPKVRGTWNLHRLLPQDLDFFVMLSSVVAMVGNIGQSNYAAACSFQDGLAHYRKRQGLNAYSINVGAVVEAGYVSENPEVAENLRRNGIGLITLAQFFSHLNHAIQNDTENCQSSIGFVPSEHDLGLGSAHYMADKRFAHLGHGSQVGKQTADMSSDLGAVLKAAKSYDEALDTVRKAIVRQLATILALGAEEVISERSLDSYGVDSLVGVELRNWISAYLGVNLPLLALWRTNSIDELAVVVTKDVKISSAS